MPNNEELGIRRGRFVVTPAEMNNIFEPVVGKIIELVKGQVVATKKKVKTVLLVGGFGQNNYLKERLRSSLDNSILVLQPPNAWTAVARGAVMMGLARTDAKLSVVGLGSRAARKHYGVELNVVFEVNKHDESKK
jgi:tRNA A37 threonylcarbamoyltransferase TsaD